jgi:hypothetical protein
MMPDRHQERKQCKPRSLISAAKEDRIHWDVKYELNREILIDENFNFSTSNRESFRKITY